KTVVGHNFKRLLQASCAVSFSHCTQSVNHTMNCFLVMEGQSSDTRKQGGFVFGDIRDDWGTSNACHDI
ncbi:hypothetical protein A260_28641, partial [Pseudomonas syringae pv. actinidiae ICMP 19068]